MGVSRPPWLFLILALPLLLTACVTLPDPEAAQEGSGEVIGVVQAGQDMGQSFVARRPQVSGIALWLAPVESASEPSGTLDIELYRSDDLGTPVRKISLSQARVSSGGMVSVSFAPLPGPAGQSYTLRIHSNGASTRMLGRAEDVYPHGEAFLNGAPLQADLAFRLSYDYGLQAILTDLLSGLKDSWLALPLAIIILLPGWLLLSFLKLGERLDAGERLAVSVGLSLAVIPVALTWTSLAGLRWSRAGLLVAAGLLLALAAWRLFSRRPARLEPDWTFLALSAVFGLALFIRLAMTRDLAAPAWVDSVHHATITRRILEEGAFPASYAPYIDIETASYHAGFHSVLAAFTALSGLPVDRAMLLLGQVLNALAVLAVYLFTTTLLGDRRAGVIAALVAGLFTPMPAYYASWGRYTQLTGLVIFPAVLVLLKLGFDTYESLPEGSPPGDRWRAAAKLSAGSLLAAAVAGGGLFLTHYRVAAFLGLLLLVYLPTRAAGFRFQGGRPGRFWFELAMLAAAGLAGIALIFPWLPQTVAGLFLPKVVQWSGGNPAPFSDFSWAFLTTAMGRQALVLAGLGMLAGLFLLKGFPFYLALWVGLMFFLANLGALGLPGSGFVNNTSVEISLFLPISAAAGYFASRILGAWGRAVPQGWRRANAMFLAALILVAALFAARTLLPILNPITFLFREADRPAMTWAAENIPSGETVLINPFSWGYGLYAGNDGGYWISPLAGRETMPPPALYGLANDSSTLKAINATVEQAVDYREDPAGLQDLLLERNIHYVYLGARGGVFSPRLLRESGRFELLYAQAGVWIFKVKPEL